MTRTHSTKASEITRDWWVIDADGAVLGRLAAQVAHLLRGKHKPIFVPHLDTGDHVVVINASKVRLTGTKRDTKMWHHYSGYPGGLRSTPYGRLLKQRPEMVVERAVKGMLPHNRLGRAMFGKLKVYAGPEHPHAAQQPKTMAATR